MKKKMIEKSLERGARGYGYPQPNCRHGEIWGDEIGGKRIRPVAMYAVKVTFLIETTIE